MIFADFPWIFLENVLFVRIMFVYFKENVMARGLFAIEDQLRKIDSNGDPLVKINQFTD